MSAFTGSGALGSPWTIRAGSFTVSNGSATCVDYALATIGPAAADCDVSVDIRVAFDTAPGIVGRASETAATYYYWRYLPVDAYQLYRFLNGGIELLGSYARSEPLDSTVRLTLRMRGTAITGLVNGTERVSVVDTVLTSGVAGIRNGGSGSMATFSNFETSSARRYGVSAPLMRGIHWETRPGISL